MDWALGMVVVAGAGLMAGGAALSASSANKNANKAADTAAANTAANNALTKEIYGENKATLQPFVNTGVAAGNLLNDFYGVSTPESTYTTGNPNYSAYVQGNPDLLDEYGRVAGDFGNDMSAYGQYHYNSFGRGEGRTVPGVQTVTTGGTGTGGGAKSAFANYIANSDYAFQQQEGGNSVNSGYAGAGTVQSGAAMRALEKYRQNLQSGYRQQWAGGVANQQGVGVGAASALAGVSTDYANTIAASNTAASDARANAALSQQNVFGNALGTAGAGILKGFG